MILGGSNEGAKAKLDPVQQSLRRDKSSSYSVSN